MSTDGARAVRLLRASPDADASRRSLETISNEDITPDVRVGGGREVSRIGGEHEVSAVGTQAGAPGAAVRPGAVERTRFEGHVAGLAVEHIHVIQIVEVGRRQARGRHERHEPAVAADGDHLVCIPGCVHALSQWQWEEAEQAFRRSIELNPSYALARLWYANMLVSRRRFDEALREVSVARDLDPFSLVVNTNIGWVLQLAGRHEEAAAQLTRTLELDPDFEEVAHLLDRSPRTIKREWRLARAWLYRELHRT